MALPTEYQQASIAMIEHIQKVIDNLRLFLIDEIDEEESHRRIEQLYEELKSKLTGTQVMIASELSSTILNNLLKANTLLLIAPRLDTLLSDLKGPEEGTG
jgi:hypothetical protein